MIFCKKKDEGPKPALYAIGTRVRVKDYYLKSRGEDIFSISNMDSDWDKEPLYQLTNDLLIMWRRASSFEPHEDTIKIGNIVEVIANTYADLNFKLFDVGENFIVSNIVTDSEHAGLQVKDAEQSLDNWLEGG